jgi:FKBP-type peptidyl-prolyl cis-trans isomerase 2
MKKAFLTIVYIAAAIFATGCAKTEKVGPNDAYQRYFDAWMQLNYPDAQPTGLGIYIIEEELGKGNPVGGKGYVLIDYKVTDLEGNISSYSEAVTARQVGTYKSTNYYGPTFWTTVETTLPAGVREAVVGAPIGTYRKVIIPSWLMSYQAYDSEEDYLNPPLKKDEKYDASSYTNSIYEFTVRDYTEDMNQWQIDSIGRFFANKVVKIDGKPADETFVTDSGNQMTAADSVSTGFYYKQLKAPVDTASFAADTTIYINYVGKLLNGLVFDTNVERVAKDNDLYSPGKAYGPTKITWGEDYSAITMGTDKSTVIAGFAKTLWEMKAMEKGVGVFYSNLGYSHSGSGSSIPGYAPLIFEIEIVAKPEE